MRRAIAAAMLILGVGCSGAQRLSLQPRSGLTSDDYGDVLDDWTRDDKIYEMLDSIMFVFATFHSPEFRKAFILRHPDVYGPGSEEARRLTLTDTDAEAFHEFFVSASTSDAKNNDLEKNKGSIWRITLVGDGDEVVEGEVRKVKPTANIRRIYPHVSDYARTYLIRFPLTGVGGKPLITSNTSEFTLRIASALGTAEMTWQLQPPR